MNGRDVFAPTISWTIRSLEPRDIEPVRALWAASEGLGTGPGDSREGVARFLERNPGLSLVAEAAGRLVGAVLCGHDGRRGFLYRLAIAPRFRRHGLAHEIVERCLAGLKAEGIERCLVFVLAENRKACAFWAAVGGRSRPELSILSLEVGPA